MLGISRDELVSCGLDEYDRVFENLKNEVEKDERLILNRDFLEIATQNAKMEALLHAVAAMIESNNNALQEQLKALEKQDG